MPLHVARLRDSDLAAEAHPEGCWYAVLLWAASWHQIPAGSLPDNDAVLARLCGLGRDLRTFRKHKNDALRGFIRCCDERIYHPVVAEQALSAWRSKVEQRHRAECARIKKANQRNGTELEAPTFAEFMSRNFPLSVPYLSPGTDEHVPRDEGSKREGQGQREGQRDSIDDVGDGACADAEVEQPDLPAPVDEFPRDLISLTSEVCRAAGIRHIDPGRIIQHQSLVKEWLDAGFDPVETIMPAVQQAVSQATERIASLRYFDSSIRQFNARKEARTNGYSTGNDGARPLNPMVRAVGARRARRAAEDRGNELLCLPPGD